MIIVCAVLLITSPCIGLKEPSGSHVTALVGKNVVLDCPLKFPDGRPMPYVIEWKIQKLSQPLYIWYDGYQPHVADGYRGRVSRVTVASRRHGLASLSVTNVTHSDAGWYECTVHFLDRHPAVLGNGTWVHLDVHAPPRLVSTPPSDVFVNVGDSVILACRADGTPQPTISWLKGTEPIVPSETVAVRNDGTELRMTRLGEDDIGYYSCSAKNSEGSVNWTSRIIMAGGAVIVEGPSNQTRKASSRAVLMCRTRARPNNVTVVWLRHGVKVDQLEQLEQRVRTARNGSLIIDPVVADDAGMFTCQASNGIGTPQRASAFLDVRYGAYVSYTPTVQYLAAGHQGVIHCHIKANPPIQFVTWYHNSRAYDPKQVPGVSTLSNGSLLIDQVNVERHQGTYRCRPFNLHGTAGQSGQMQVVVRQAPRFVVRPRNLYQRRQQHHIEMPCVVDGSPPPQVTWRRHDNKSMPSDRVTFDQGNITIRLLQKSDFGYYECVARNSVATVVTSTQLVVEGTTPHAPHNITTNTSSSAVTIRWLPGYGGGDNFDQKYAVWYRKKGADHWNTFESQQNDGATGERTIYHLLANTQYVLMVAAKNDLGDNMFSEKVTVRTLEVGEPASLGASADTAAMKEDLDNSMEVAGAPVDVNVTEAAGGFLVRWQPPVDSQLIPLIHYSVLMKTGDGEYKPLEEQRLTKTQLIVRQLQGGRTYHFKVLALSMGSSWPSAVTKYLVPDHVQQKAITAALVGGLLLLIVSIILSVCTVKICNKRKRRKHEKEYSMVACRPSEGRSGLNSPAPLARVLDKGDNSSVDHY